MLEKFIFLFFLVVTYVVSDDLIVKLPDGTIRGHQITSENISFNAWQGIPYATPPLGRLRFQAPLPPQSWSGIKAANKSGNSCFVLVHYSWEPDLGNQSEDCLYLNVYAPVKKSNKTLPVMFFIYGGGLVAGSSNQDFYGPNYVIKEDVIVVNFNYRIALLGFLSTGDDVVLGNAGLKDQLLALKWTKKNINLFGGDPNQITIFGESAGGVAVGIHLRNKKSAGLYRAAICQSGCSLAAECDLFVTEQKNNTYNLAKIIDPTISDLNTTQEVVNLLQSVSTDVLIAANKNVSVQAGFVIEADNKNAYITKNDASRIRTLFEDGEFNRVPLMIGNIVHEGLAFTQPLSNIKTLGLNYDNEPATLVPTILNPKNGTNLTQVGNLIKNAYVGQNGSFSNNLLQVIEFFGDMKFARSTLKQAQIQSRFTPVYLYQFSYYGTVSEMRGYPDIEGVRKVSHADEMPYLLKMSTFNLKTKSDFLIRDRMARLWTNFAKTLNPTPDALDSLLNVTWPQVTPENIQYLDIDETLKIKPNRKAKEFAMWNYVYDTYGTPPFTGF